MIAESACFVEHHHALKLSYKSPSSEAFHKYGDTTSAPDSLESSPQSKPVRRRRLDRTITAAVAVSTSNNNNNNDYITTHIHAHHNLNNHHLNNNNNNNPTISNNNHVKNERLSPGTADLSSRSRSVTPSSHSDTPPADTLMPPVTSRNYSDFMRSLAAKYNNTNPNDYFSAVRNGFPPPVDPRFKPSNFPGLLPNPVAAVAAAHNNNNNKDPADLSPSTSISGKKTDFTSLLSSFGSPFPPLIDMSTTQTLLAMVRSAKEAELHGLLKNVKRQQESASPLDLSAAAPPSTKRPRLKMTTTTSSAASSVSPSSTSLPVIVAKRAQSESPRLQEDVSSWTVEDVCGFVGGIDICAEYAQNFRDQRIDGSGLPLLTEDHLTTTMGMKLGPALKLRSILAKKLGTCSVCLHCTHCHNNSGGSPEPTNATGGNTSDSGAAS